MGVTYNTSIVRDGLVLHLDAANTKSYPGVGTVWKDLSGNGINGTHVNTVEYEYGAMYYAGTNMYTSLPNNVADFSGDWSVCVWIKPYSDSNPRVMSFITTNDNLTVGYMATTLKPYIRIDGTSNQTETASLSAGEWNYVVYQMNNGTREVHINGISVTMGGAAISANAQRSAIGGGYSGYEMNGYVSVGQVYNRALSEQEIKQNFNAHKSRFGL